MISVEYDLRFYRASLEILQNYLLSRDLYWPPPDVAPQGEPPYQSMTLGSILLSRRRLDHREMMIDQQSELARLDLLRDRLYGKWQTAWEKKAYREVTVRINQWRDFIVDYRDQPDANADRFSTEARSRAMIELLMMELPADHNLTNLRNAIKELDAGLHLHWCIGDFHWPSVLIRSFPETTFWFLYGELVWNRL
jgi:hypothetical protein